MIKAILFDLDGTLFNTLVDLKNATNHVLKQNDIDVITLEETRAFVGNGVKNLVKSALKGNDFNLDEMYANFKKYYALHLLDNSHPYLGIMELLKKLKEKGYQTAIVSNKFQEGVDLIKKAFFKDIDIALGETEGLNRKPSPDGVNKVLELLEVNKDEAIYVGDSEVDYLTAKNSSIKFIGVSWGYRDASIFKENNVKYIIDKPSELLDILGDNNEI